MAQDSGPEDRVLLPTLMAGSHGAIVPRTFDDCYRMGKMLAISGFVPKDFAGKPEACTVAIMQGLELGLSPVAALQSIAVINGRPSLWGDGLLAIIRASGLLEWMEETDNGGIATCAMKRRGDPKPVVRSFSEADAKIAGLNSNVWKSYPARMRQMRARAFCARDAFPDVLKGCAVAEEQQDIPLPNMPMMRDVTPAKPAPVPLDEIPSSKAPPPVPAAVAAPAKPQPTVPVAETSGDDFLERPHIALTECTDPDQLGELWIRREDEAQSLGVYEAAAALVGEHEKRLGQ